MPVAVPHGEHRRLSRIPEYSWSVKISVSRSPASAPVPDMMVPVPCRFERVWVLQSKAAWNFVSHLSVPEPMRASEPVNSSAP
jgi:hypothetical protein